MNATTKFGAAGGDKVRARANNLDTRRPHTCRFVRLTEYDVSLEAVFGALVGTLAGALPGSQYLDAPATAVDDRTVTCVTPAWGAHFPATDVRVLLLEGNGRDLVVLEHFREAEFTFSFYEV